MLIGLSKKQDAHKTRVFRALRSDCDMLLSVGLAELYDRAEAEEESTLEVIKWTRAYDRLEQMVEQVVKLAEAIEEAVLKNV
jgi:beta-glucosidase-like glycosyl hydrolase